MIEEGLMVCEKNVPELIIKSKLGVIDVFSFPKHLSCRSESTNKNKIFGFNNYLSIIL